MNRTKIEWTTYTWNPVSGCLNNCSYCYARKLYRRFRRDFTPKFHPERLEEPYKLKKPSMIFTGSVTDLFGWWVDESWLLKIFKVMDDNLDHVFQVLTKFPQNIKKFPAAYRLIRALPNLWLGVTVNTQNDMWRVEELATIQTVGRKFVSVEPMFSRVTFQDLIYEIDWIIVGAQTNPLKLPEKSWVKELISEAEKANIPIFLKDNLKPLFKNLIQTYPAL